MRLTVGKIDSPMKLPEPLVGTWRSVKSDIPGYEAGNEYLCFSSDGRHSWAFVTPPKSLRGFDSNRRFGRLTFNW